MFYFSFLCSIIFNIYYFVNTQNGNFKKNLKIKNIAADFVLKSCIHHHYRKLSISQVFLAKTFLRYIRLTFT